VLADVPLSLAQQASESAGQRRALGLERPLGPLVEDQQHDQALIGARRRRRRLCGARRARASGNSGEEQGGAGHVRGTITRAPARASTIAMADGVIRAPHRGGEAVTTVTRSGTRARNRCSCAIPHEQRF
jgi:hypothetical protein